MAVQAFLMTCDHAEIFDPVVFVKHFAKKPCSVFDKYRICGIQLCKSLLILPFDHNLRFSGNCFAAEVDEIFEPKRFAFGQNNRDPSNGTL